MLHRHQRHQTSYQGYRAYKNCAVPRSVALLNSSMPLRKLVLHAFLFLVIVFAAAVVCMQLQDRYSSPADTWHFSCDPGTSTRSTQYALLEEPTEVAYAVETPAANSHPSHDKLFALMLRQREDTANQVVCKLL